MKSKLIASLLCLILTQLWLRAGEGMWLPLFLEQLNETEMRAMGMRMSARDIYDVNQGSLKDAIVHFGGFCTGEVISSQGLVLTNHHCGYDAIQTHSTLANNYLETGFWAANHAAELPNPGLFVTFIVRIEDVTAAALAGVTDALLETDRQSMIDLNLNKVKAAARIESYQDVLIRPFFHGNQYFLFVTETYRDVRLVGAPPSSIGKFGADTDNWVWPRHTGDFSLFRIYAGPDNKPAAYSPDNVPFKPRKHLNVSLDGVAEGDFTMVFGFPGRTDEYLPAAAVEQRVNVLNPIRVGIRDQTLDIMGQAMRADAQVKIQYASKQASIANSWKKWLGETQGINRTGGIARKREMEAEFSRRVNANTAWKAAYGQLLPEMERLYQEIEPYAQSRDYVLEIVGRNVELFQLASRLKAYVNILHNNGEAALLARAPGLQEYLRGFYQDYSADLDQDIAAALLHTYSTKLNPAHRAPYVAEQLDYAGGNHAALAQTLYQQSFLTKAATAIQLAEQDPVAFIRQAEGDFAYTLVQKMIDFHTSEVNAPFEKLNNQLIPLQRRYMQALMEVFPERKFYPDANSTLRVTYGQMASYTPRDAVHYEPMTYLEGVMEKYVAGDYEFDVPERLRQLFAAKDYGPYAEEGKLPVCFIGSNHTTGGNSGSPAVDAYGNLIGLNFDRTWEGTMSDVYYDASICRNIMVDIRYILFVIDKYAGATHLVQEMTLVHPKGR